MEQGAPAIFQAAFLQLPWSGFADFLIRVDAPSDLGAWSYAPVDTKLARSAKASHIVQLGVYVRMVAAIQDKEPRRIHVELGDRKSVVKGKSVSVRVDLGGRHLNKKK